ncbi:MAG: DNA primase regulatory subunit PriL [Candidatus Hydrothermarchaeota archaeon]
MDERHLYRFPFIPEAKRYIERLDIPLDSLITSRAYEGIRRNAQIRLIRALERERIEKEPLDLNKLLSYIFSNLLVSHINDEYLIRRYALFEAKQAHIYLKSLNKEKLIEIASSLRVNARLNQDFLLYFVDFLELTNILRNDPKYKLIAHKMKKGYIELSKFEFCRILQEKIRFYIQSKLPIPIPEQISGELEKYALPIKKIISKNKKKFEKEIYGKVSPYGFPPCIKSLMSGINAGENISHMGRFALVTFLLNIGMKKEDIISIFTKSLDFEEKKTVYQVEHISGMRGSGTVYSPPACSTLKTFQLCMENDFCKGVKHPLTYYKRRMDASEKKIL